MLQSQWVEEEESATGIINKEDGEIRQVVEEIMESRKKYLFAKILKYDFQFYSNSFLGYVVCEKGMMVDPPKIKVVNN